jgi:4,5-dihydroxyphthalate decarboxylase
MSDPVILLARHYDRVAALLDGRVQVGRRKVRWEVAPSIPDSFRRMMNDPDILAGEMSFGFQAVVASSQERSRFVAIPVFPSRSFRHGNVFVRSDSPLTSFGQLRGRKVALEEYAMTMGIWVRALFEEAGVAPEEIHWVTGRDPVVVPEVEAELRKRLRLDRATRSLWALLRDGEVDAVVGRPPDYRDVEGGAFRRLLNDHWGCQRDYYRTTQIFPPMHVLVVRRDAFESDPAMNFLRPLTRPSD